MFKFFISNLPTVLDILDILWLSHGGQAIGTVTKTDIVGRVVSSFISWAVIDPEE